MCYCAMMRTSSWYNLTRTALLQELHSHTTSPFNSRSCRESTLCNKPKIAAIDIVSCLNNKLGAFEAL